MSDVKKNNEILLWLGRWTSKIGNIVFDYVNSILIVSLCTKNSFLMAAYQGSEAVVKILIGLFGGAISDKHNARKMLILTDMFSALLCLICSFLIKSKFIAYIIVIINVLLEVSSVFNSPAYKTIVRKAIKSERVSKFNSISNGGSEAIGLLAPLVGVVLIEAFGPRSGMIFNAVTFFVSAIIECRVVMERSTTKKKSTHLIKDVVDGAKYLISNSNVLFIIIFSMCVNFVLAGYNLLIPYTEVMYKEFFPHSYSILLIVEGLGGVLGSIISSKIRFDIDKTCKKLIFLVLAAGVALCLVFPITLLKVYIIILIPFLAFIIFITIYNIQFMTYVQLKVDEEYIGRVFSMITTLSTLLLPAGGVFFSVWIKPNDKVSFTYMGAFIVIISLVSLICLMRLGKRNDNV